MTWHRESRRHSLASKGIKSAQKIPKSMIMKKPQQNTIKQFNSIIKRLNVLFKPYNDLWKQEEQGKITEEQRKIAIKNYRIKIFNESLKLHQELLDMKINPDKEMTFDYGEYGVTKQLEQTGQDDTGKVVWMSPDEYLHFVKPYRFENFEGKIIKSETFFFNDVKRILDYSLKRGKLSVGYLEVKNGKVTGQEGRHTTICAKILGVKKMPVVILDDYKTFDIKTTRPYYQGSIS